MNGQYKRDMLRGFTEREIISEAVGPGAGRTLAAGAQESANMLSCN